MPALTPRLIKTLFQKAFEDYKNKFLEYILAFFISLGISIAAILATLLSALLLWVIFLLSQKTVVLIVLSISSLAYSLLGLYLTSWSEYILTKTLVEKEYRVIEGLKNSFREALPWFKYKTYLLFFNFGLFWTIVLPIYWAIFDSLSIFAFLHQKQTVRKRKLEYLWRARETAKGSEKIVLFLSALFVLFFILLFVALKERALLLTLLTLFFIYPLKTLTFYKLYQRLQEEKPSPNVQNTGKRSTTLSLIGWVLFLLAGMGSIISFILLIPPVP